MAGTDGQRTAAGALSVAISNGVVGLFRQYAGRGPTKARTTIARDHVLVVVRDTLTTGERTLRDAGYVDEVMATRRRVQDMIGPAATRLVEDLTGRRVVAFMSDNHVDPDLGIELFILEPDEEDAHVDGRLSMNGN